MSDSWRRSRVRSFLLSARESSQREASATPNEWLETLGESASLGDLAGRLGRSLERAPGVTSCSVVLRSASGLETLYETGGDDDRAHGTGRECSVPIRRGGQVVGLLLAVVAAKDLLATRERMAVVAHCAAAEIGRLDAEQRADSDRRHLEEMSRYVPGPICGRLARDLEIESGERELSVLFLDLRGYTAQASALRCSQVFRLLNRYVGLASSLLRRHGGTIVEFNGDGMMAVFGVPEPLAAKERSAVAAALEIAECVPGVLGRTNVYDPSHPAMGIGIATGPGFVGSIAAEDRLIWSAVGATTNLASRLQGLARDLGAAIVLDETTWRSADPVAERFERRPDVTVRGLAQPIALYALSAS